MWRNPSFVIKKQVKFQEGKQCLLLPTISPPTILKPRTVCCQEGEDDKDMTPSDMTTDYLVRSFRHLHSNFWYNSLGSICTCLYLIEGTIMFQSASLSKSNIWLPQKKIQHLVRQPNNASSPLGSRPR